MLTCRISITLSLCEGDAPFSSKTTTSTLKSGTSSKTKAKTTTIKTRWTRAWGGKRLCRAHSGTITYRESIIRIWYSWRNPPALSTYQRALEPKTLSASMQTSIRIWQVKCLDIESCSRESSKKTEEKIQRLLKSTSQLPSLPGI